MELRHLRYFTAVVQWKGYREASRRLHVAQAAISRTVADLEDELGLKLFSRAKRMARLTPQGELFHVEAMRTLAQAESAINTAKRAAKGELGKLSIGFLGSATYAFLPALVCIFKRRYPGVKLCSRNSYRSSRKSHSTRGRSTSDLLICSNVWSHELDLVL